MEKIKDELRELFPGRVVRIQTAKGDMEVRVFPIGLMHLAEFGEKIARTVDAVVRALSQGDDQTITALAAVGMDDKAAMLVAVAPRALPIIIRELGGLVEECTTWPVEGMSLESVPHNVGAEVVAAWLAEQFDQKKSEGWAALGAGLKGLLPAGGFASTTQSRPSSGREDTASARSSTNSSQAGPIAAGAQSSSG